MLSHLPFSSAIHLRVVQYIPLAIHGLCQEFGSPSVAGLEEHVSGLIRVKTNPDIECVHDVSYSYVMK